MWRATLAPETSLAAQNLVARDLAATLAKDEWPSIPAEAHALWMKRAAHPAGQEVELMRAFDFAKVRAKDVLQRLERMEGWEPHPIVTRWLVDVFARQTRAPLADGLKCFRRVFNLLTTHLDHEGASTLRSWIGSHGERIQASPYGSEFFDAGMRRVLKHAEKKCLAAARPLEAAERQALADAGLLEVREPTLPDLSLELLFAAVYRNPADDEPRHILADYLQQRGDPRGEFIALDLLPKRNAAQTRRRAALLKLHGKAWFPKALHKVVKRSAEYERGFLAVGELLQRAEPIELSTFRELTATFVPNFDADVFRAIEAWLDIPIESDQRFTTCKPNVTRIGLLTSFRTSPEQVVGLLRHDAWPALAEVAITARSFGLGDWNQPSAPQWLDRVGEGMAQKLRNLRRIDVMGVARYERAGDGAYRQSIVLPTILSRAIFAPRNGFSPFSDESAVRWQRWLEAKQADNVPIEHQPPKA